jgi:RNA polymerase sigma factor (sigma-70 family)
MNYQGDSFYIEQVLNGDRNAFAQLVDQYKCMVFTVAYRIVRNQEDAEEIAQDTFIKAYQSLGQFEKKSKFSTWLYRIVFNSSISHTRKRKHEMQQLNFDIVQNFTSDDLVENLEILDHAEQKKLINHLMNNLDPDDSAIITLFYMEDRTTEEIAEITGLSQSNVKVKLHRIRGKMQSDLHKLRKNNLNKIYN